MTWKSKLWPAFELTYDTNSNLQELFDLGINIILESEDPGELPLTARWPGTDNHVMMNLQNNHFIIIQICYDENTVEFIHCV